MKDGVVGVRLVKEDSVLQKNFSKPLQKFQESAGGHILFYPEV